MYNTEFLHHSGISFYWQDEEDGSIDISFCVDDDCHYPLAGWNSISGWKNIRLFANESFVKQLLPAALDKISTRKGESK